jgi:hypothetical protein
MEKMGLKDWNRERQSIRAGGGAITFKNPMIGKIFQWYF